MEPLHSFSISESRNYNWNRIFIQYVIPMQEIKFPWRKTLFWFREFSIFLYRLPVTGYGIKVDYGVGNIEHILITNNNWQREANRISNHNQSKILWKPERVWKDDAWISNIILYLVFVFRIGKNVKNPLLWLKKAFQMPHCIYIIG